MKTAAIICEYNPFHNGHLFQIEQIKKQLNPDHIIAVMSGDFVQRGTPAFCDKYDRARFALSNGISLVFELPVCCATASAEYFAYGAISLLDSLNSIDYLVFGAESDQIDKLNVCAKLFSEEPDNYRTALWEHLKQGLSFPAARQRAASLTLGEDVCDLLDQPNNILGIEYLKALYRCNSDIKPYVIKRTGTGYHDQNFSQMIASASAIRNHINAHGCDAQIKNAVPEIVQDYLQQNHHKTFPIQMDDLADMIFHQLITNPAPEHILDYHPELWNRLQCFDHENMSVTDLITKVKTKNFTYSRISRFLIHLMLGVNDRDPDTSYGKILGIRRDSTKLLKLLNQTSTVPLIQKTSQYKHILTSGSLASYEQTLQATRLYRYLLRKKYSQDLPDELHQPLLLV
jgi:predicted nucleotidyltransferase